MRKASIRPNAAHERDEPHGPRRFQSLLFAAGDLAFLVAVGAVTTTGMHWLHRLEWDFLATCMLGMILAMLAQMLMAWSAAPLLGSIETMLPSMVVAMVSPMLVCSAHLMGCPVNWPECAALGAAFGVAVFIFIQAWGRAYRRSLSRAFLCR